MAADHIALSSHPPAELRKLPTLFSQQGVDRTAFYGNRPYAHLRAEFERRLQQLQHAGQTPDPKVAQIERLKADVDKLNDRLAQANSTIEELSDFRTQALARLAAQHDEILRLRAAAARNANVTRLSAARQKVIGPC
jgi:chromosome segregation ATPase